MMRVPQWIAQALAALRVVLALTLLVGIAYPLAMFAVAQLPGLRNQAAGSPLTGANGAQVGSRLIGQSFTDADGKPIRRYFQSRPSNAGAGYDPTASAASNLGANSVVDVLGDPTLAGTPGGDGGKPSLLTKVCARSKAVGDLEGVDGRRPYCAADGVGAVLGVFRQHGLTGPALRVVSLNQACPATPFLPSYEGVAVQCATFGEDYGRAVVTPIRGDAPAKPAVPVDAVTASASGLDPDISLAYAQLQAPRVARERGVDLAAVSRLIADHTTGRALGVLGEPAVNVLELNVALDRSYPKQGA
jgi:K+-transporting ATPase ATPase C chain